MRKHGKAIFLLLTTSLVIACWLWPSKTEIPAIKTADNHDVIAPINNESIETDDEERKGFGVDFDTANYALCTEFLSDVEKYNTEWSRENYVSWKALIEDGRYSLNEVTLAVEYFLNSNFAESFRLEYLRANAPLTQRNNSISSDILAMFPSMSDLGFNVSIKVPNPAFENFSAVTLEEKEQIISQHKVTIDDVAYFLVEDSMSEPDILMLIAALEDSHHRVSYTRFGAITLLDYAILSARPLAVETLLDNGHQLTMDEYLGSSMEWALHVLQHGYYSGKREQAVQVIKQLMALDAPARFSSKTRQLVKGSFPRRFYEFEAEQLADLMIEFNLDLTQIPARQSITADPSHPLIIALKEQQTSEYARRRGVANINELVSQCEDTKLSLSNEWVAESAYSVITRLSNNHIKDQESLLAELAYIDPYLIDFYNRHMVQPTPRESINEGLMDRLDDAYELFRNGKVEQAIEHALSASFHETQRQWVMLKLLSFGPEVHPAVFSTPLHNELDDYSELAIWRLLSKPSIESMLDAGAPINYGDRFGKTLVFYAALNRDIELLDYLLDKGVMFHSDALGQDPLHVTLNINRNVADLRKLEDALDSLMQFQSSIDVYHLRRMKLINTYYPATYERIIEKHPKLRVNEDIGLPAVYFN